MFDNVAFYFPNFSSPNVHIAVSYVATAMLVVTAVTTTSLEPALIPIHTSAGVTTSVYENVKRAERKSSYSSST